MTRQNGGMQSLETPHEIARRFDERAEHYDESPFHKALATAVAQFAAASTSGRVLDVATGTGLVLRAMAASTARLVGVDVSPGMIAVARRSLPDAQFIVADASAPLEFPEGSFDLITCVTALHLLPDPAGALGSWRPLLAPGGRVVVGVFRTDEAREVPEVAEALARGVQRQPHGSHDALHERTGTRQALERLAAQAGFVLSRSQTWVYPEPFEVCLLAELTPVA